MLAVYHMFLLHWTSSTSPGSNNGEGKRSMFYFIFVKDLFLVWLLDVCMVVFTIGLLNCLHPANNNPLSVCLESMSREIGNVEMVNHIVPEWYLLPSRFLGLLLFVATMIRIANLIKGNFYSSRFY